MMKRLVLAVAVAALVLAGCSDGDDEPDSAQPTLASADPALLEDAYETCRDPYDAATEDPLRGAGSRDRASYDRSLVFEPADTSDGPLPATIMVSLSDDLADRIGAPFQDLMSCLLSETKAPDVVVKEVFASPEGDVISWAPGVTLSWTSSDGAVTSGTFSN